MGGIEDYASEVEVSKYLVVVMDRKCINGREFNLKGLLMFPTEEPDKARRIHEDTLRDFFLKDRDRYIIHILKRPNPDEKYRKISKKEI